MANPTFPLKAPPTHTTKPTSGTPAPPPAVSHPTPAPLSNGQQSAFDLLNATLASWGLSSLSNVLRTLVLKGDTNPDTLSLELSQTKEYKQRFAANEARAKAGLPQLKPAEYIAMEEGYRNVLNAYGFPKGFYDSRDDFTKLIAGDVSVDEVRARAQVAHDQYMNAPGYVKTLWGQYFGTKGDALAAILDPNTATQLIQDRGQQVALGGAAAQVGLGIDQKRAQQLQQAGITLDGARQAYQKIATALPTDQSIAQRFGTSFDQTQEENDLLLGNAQAGVKRQTLYSSEQALFHGSSGLSSDAIGVSHDY